MEKEEFKKIIDEKILKDREERDKRLRELWDKLPKFKDPSDVPAIPRVPAEEYKSYYVPKIIAAGGIPKKDLVDGKCYIGEHRNATVAKWNEGRNKFEYWRHKFNDVYTDVCNHFEDDDGYALFVPIRIATQEEFDETK